MDLQKSTGERSGELTARRSQLDCPMKTSKQLTPEILFERTYVSADRGLRHVQLASGVGEAEVTGCSLEGTQREQRRWAAGGHVLCRVDAAAFA